MVSLKSGDKVYIHLGHRHSAPMVGVVVSDAFLKHFQIAERVYYVKLVRGGKLFLKAFHVHQLSRRTAVLSEDELLCAPVPRDFEWQRWPKRRTSKRYERPPKRDAV